MESEVNPEVKKVAIPAAMSLDEIPEITAFVRKHQLIVHRHNERPWGGYELAISRASNPQAGVIADRAWGSLIPIAIALQDVLIQYATSQNPNVDFAAWLGADEFKELQAIFI